MRAKGNQGLSETEGKKMQTTAAGGVRGEIYQELTAEGRLLCLGVGLAEVIFTVCRFGISLNGRTAPALFLLWAAFAVLNGAVLAEASERCISQSPS